TNACPADQFAPNTLECRSPSCTGGLATIAANCTGSDTACPALVTQSCAPFTCKGTACGGNCAVDTDCTSGHCADGYCCDTTCGGSDPTDCQACNVAGSLGTCMAEPNVYVCRAAFGICDLADKCNGVSTTCGVDAKQPKTTVCRPSVDLCDLADTCDGTTN